MDSTSKFTDENIVNGGTSNVVENGIANGQLCNSHSQENGEQEAPTGQKKIVVVGLGMVAIAFMCVARPPKSTYIHERSMLTLRKRKTDKA
jgi:hypothetical protein